MDNRPIGVFDSGLGGLTAVRALRSILPHENIVYFGDTARVPYGPRGVETIKRFSLSDLKFVNSLGVKAVLAACVKRIVEFAEYICLFVKIVKTSFIFSKVRINVITIN